jgi:DNA-binding transcriptional LysR family regulator
MSKQGRHLGSATLFEVGMVDAIRVPKKWTPLGAPEEREVRAPRKLRPSENHLYFEAVVRHGSIRKAADSLHIASSALNRRILELEHEVGTALFERLPRGVRLTAAGEVLMAYVRVSLKELQRAELQIEQLCGEARGIVRVAVAESVTSFILPKAITEYQARHPGIGFQVSVAGPQALLDALHNDNAEAILTHEVPQAPGVSVLARASHPLVALVSPGHPLARSGEVGLAECMLFPLAIPHASLAARSVLDAAMEDAGLTMEPALESESIETLNAFARYGSAISFSFRLGNREPFPGLVSLRIRDARCQEASLVLAVRRGRVLPVAAASFVELMSGYFAEPTLRTAFVA